MGMDIDSVINIYKAVLAGTTGMDHTKVTTIYEIELDGQDKDKDMMRVLISYNHKTLYITKYYPRKVWETMAIVQFMLTQYATGAEKYEGTSSETWDTTLSAMGAFRKTLDIINSTVDDPHEFYAMAVETLTDSMIGAAIEALEQNDKEIKS